MKKILLILLFIPLTAYGANRTFTDGEGIDSTTGSTTFTVDCEEASTTNKGVASFNSTDFGVSSGVVTVTNDGHDHTGTSVTGFLVDDASDTTSGTITAAGLTTTGTVSGVTVRATTLRTENYTFPESVGTDNYILKLDGATLGWEADTGGAGSGDLLADGTIPLTADWDVGDFDITLNSLTSDGTISGTVVDTQFLEYSTGGNVTVRDGLVIQGAGDSTIGSDLDVDGTVTSSNLSGSKTIQFSIAEPDQLDASDLLAVWSNESTETFTISSIKAWSDDPLGSITLHVRDANGGNNSQLCDMTADTAGTGVYYGTGTASDSTVTTTQVIYYDYTTGTPDYIKFSVLGSY